MLEYLVQHESIVLFAALIGAFCAIAVAEMFFPRRTITRSLGFRWVNNIGLALTTTVSNRAIYLFLGLGTTSWLYRQDLGLVPLLDPHWAVGFLLVLLVLSFGDYLTHRLMHAVPLLWRLHAVHHSDTEFDVTTTYRNHPFAALSLMLMRLPFIAILGAPATMLLVYEAIRMAQDLWSHSNMRLPVALDRYLRWFIVTPDFHRVHHCSDRQFTDSNYSSTVPWYDYLFGTYRQRPVEQQVSMEIGLENFREQHHSRLDGLLLLPFRPFAPERALPASGGEPSA